MKHIFITSDTHFGHYNIIRYCDRPFTSTEEMDRVIIDNINEMVGVDDILYHLGDFAFGSYGQIINYRQRIKCKHIILILGNHDRIIFQNKHRLYNIFDDIVKFITISIASKIYLLNHYPIGEERDIEKVKAFQRYMDMGVIALHGHKHSQLPSDVGVDAHNFKPIKLG